MMLHIKSKGMKRKTISKQRVYTPRPFGFGLKERSNIEIDQLSVAELFWGGMGVF